MKAMEAPLTDAYAALARGDFAAARAEFEASLSSESDAEAQETGTAHQHSIAGVLPFHSADSALRIALISLAVSQTSRAAGA